MAGGRAEGGEDQCVASDANLLVSTNKRLLLLTLRHSHTEQASDHCHRHSASSRGGSVCDGRMRSQRGHGAEEAELAQ